MLNTACFLYTLEQHTYKCLWDIFLKCASQSFPSNTIQQSLKISSFKCILQVALFDLCSRFHVFWNHTMPLCGKTRNFKSAQLSLTRP